jgi:hypothetical protein
MNKFNNEDMGCELLSAGSEGKGGKLQKVKLEGTVKRRCLSWGFFARGKMFGVERLHSFTLATRKPPLCKINQQAGTWI